MVGTGHRGIGFWGQTVLANYGEQVEFVALCDINKGRVETAKTRMGIACATYTNFDQMMREQKPDMLVVTTVDATHHEFIIKGLEMGVKVLTEKPMTTDEAKCKAILDAEKRTGNKIIVGFNYRYSPHTTKIKELLAQKRVGDISSVDFSWYLNVYHGSDYFRRWHAYDAKSGSLWIHKATHHFDLLNWWLDSDPVEVSAYGKLENYGKNGTLRGTNCRTCDHKNNCKFYWDMSRDKWLMNLYAANEQYDGYYRDACVFREDIDIFDKMSAQIVYANGATVNYSLTTYSPYEGWRIAFNGMNGRLDSWQDIPFQLGKYAAVDQADRHAQEMSQNKNEVPTEFEEVIVMDNFSKNHESIKIPKYKGGHGGGDQRLQDMIFKDPNMPDPLYHKAGSRDGAMSIIIGIAAKKSIAEKRPVRIEELLDIRPEASRPKLG